MRIEKISAQTNPDLKSAPARPPFVSREGISGHNYVAGSSGNHGVFSPHDLGGRAGAIRKKIVRRKKFSQATAASGQAAEYCGSGAGASLRAGLHDSR
jgi:hypothetical protein